MALAVIIPIKDRLEISQCVASLLSIEGVDRVVVCDGGSTEPRCVAALHSLRHLPRVDVLHLPIAGFNKSWLINQGIQYTTEQEEILLISDADIVWNAVTIEQLITTVTTHSNTIACVQHVIESNPTAVSLRRDRYTYRMQTTATEVIVEIVPIQLETQGFSQVGDRPGCGLICARRDTVLQLGGYKEQFQGWGWEDQDLLIRASILGMTIQGCGTVLHLSHDDTTRNQHWGGLEPSHTRNCNIVACVRSLAHQELLGDLPVTLRPELRYFKPITVRLPMTLL
ncbi:glycosyltransferase [Oscillatoria sp. FACHB-1407]|uniref:glycosyltransferase family 2 protein n=1 Tax=Oscillatoria sp. FACHB-1407 TaxID=2692847 RepID=UPI001682D046|nr:glycosyltransferase [Oscillatoria sp. FACHB-1407]MBD2464740.1 glycosyltransferase [Oscillatoria sp. FACHB-1407]